jgi:flagellar hook-associated protein FlgK
MKPGDEKRVLLALKKNSVRYLFLIGGNDTANTSLQIAKAAEKDHYPLRVIHIPKTIDNDLMETDHCPGFGSVARFAAGSRTASEALSDLVASVGRAVDGAQRDATLLESARAQAWSMRESISGVNSDDEMISLTQYQRAYEASLKVVQTADEMLQELLQMKR